MRLIDADALIERWNNMSVRGRTEFDQEIMVAPSIDICFCRECKFWCCKDNKGLDGVCFKGASISQMRRPDFSIGRWRTADDFCSYGERSSE